MEDVFDCDHTHDERCVVGEEGWRPPLADACALKSKARNHLMRPLSKAETQYPEGVYDGVLIPLPHRTYVKEEIYY